MSLFSSKGDQYLQSVKWSRPPNPLLNIKKPQSSNPFITMYNMFSLI